MANIKNKINLVGAFMELEGNITLSDTCYNYNKNGGVSFSGYAEENGEAKHVNIVMDKYQVEEISKCETVTEIYDCYKQMKYF